MVPPRSTPLNQWYSLVFALNACYDTLLSWIFPCSSLCQMPCSLNLPHDKLYTYLCPQTASSVDEKWHIFDPAPLGHLTAPRFSQLQLMTGFILSSQETSYTEPSWALSSQMLKKLRAQAESWAIRKYACHSSNLGQGVPVGKAVAEGSPILDQSKLGWGWLTVSPRKTCGELDPGPLSKACV